MKLGDLISWRGQRWVVRSVDRRARLASILGEDLRTDTVPYNLDQRTSEACQVICNPSEQWPFIAVGVKNNRGRLIRIDRAVPVPTPLRMWHDWLPSDPLRMGGGPVFFNPELRLGFSESLLATFETGLPGKIVTPPGFGTVRQRQSRAAVKPKEKKTAFDRLLDEDPYEEDG
jgi:hypothetical protein